MILSISLKVLDKKHQVKHFWEKEKRKNKKKEEEIKSYPTW